ncbi:hypothetical protein KK092_11415 [Curtobacterium flaccumfaciens pv. flaccumfaciens]|uniref:hypothetical protein n=1 Tax=Curtobacterium flaccumfaciens TaxID=2035 RepID=UPI001BDE2C00|nr:hypothetical protein [Curtobacterium flaccumfaciens]MBT1669992.1 hypothetical protein [Curtobacterium flaccumfaciens pv. flaccumfaciens]
MDESPHARRARVAAWSYETEAVASLLSAAHAALRAPTADMVMLWPFLVSASAAVEKLLKLAALSMAEVESVAVKGHATGAIDDAIWAHAHRTPLPGIARHAVAQQQQNEHWQTLRDMLEGYALGRRFTYLDEDRGAPQHRPSPMHMWNDFENTIVNTSPELVAARGHFANGEDDGTIFNAARRSAVAAVLHTWTHAVLSLGEGGLLGADASVWFGQVRLGLER